VKLLILALILITSIAHSRILDASHCHQIDVLNLNYGDMNLSAIVSQINDCPTDEEIILDKVTKDFIDFYGKDKVITAKINGYELSGPKPLFQIVRNMLGSKHPEEWKEAVKDCDTVLCSFSKLFKSKKAAMQVFNFKAKTGYFLSIDQTINQGLGEQIWSAAEVQELEAAADKLPRNLQNMKLKKIERYADGLRIATHGLSTAAFASTVPELKFYDSGAKGKPTGDNSYTSTSWPQEVLIHELCHHHDFKYMDSNYNLISEKRGSIFGKLSQWKEKTNIDGQTHWIHGDNVHFVSSYAASSPAEDYAETCMNYILHPFVLEDKAPEKYAYMKKYLFKEKEFKDGSWVKKNKPKWHNLENILAEEDGCREKATKCLSNVTYMYGQFCSVENKGHVSNEASSTSWTASTCGDVGRLIKNTECIKDLKKELIDDFSKELAEIDKNFCQLGGPGVVQRRKDDVCKNAINEIADKLKELSKLDLLPFVSICESQKNFSNQCILDKIYSKLELVSNKETKSLIDKVSKGKILNRMSSLGKSLESQNTVSWLRPCFQSVEKISHLLLQSDDGTTSDAFYYSAIDDDFNSGLLGKFVYDGYRQNDINLACAKNMLESLKVTDNVLPELGTPVNLMQSHFKKEINSFEREVIKKIPESIKNCLFIKKCKLKKIKGLMEKWEAKDPEKRIGMSSDEFVEEMLKKTRPEF
jgi:hypothetical protein